MDKCTKHIFLHDVGNLLHPINMQNFEKGHFFPQESKNFFFVFHGG